MGSFLGGLIEGLTKYIDSSEQRIYEKLRGYSTNELKRRYNNPDISPRGKEMIANILRERGIYI